MHNAIAKDGFKKEQFLEETIEVLQARFTCPFSSGGWNKYSCLGFYHNMMQLPKMTSKESNFKVEMETND